MFARPRPRCASAAARFGLAVLTVLAPVTAGVGSAAADDSSADLSITGLFTPSLVRPGYVSDGQPYAQHIGLFVDSSSRSLISLDYGAPAFSAAYDEFSLKPRPGSGHMLTGAITAVLSDPRVPGVIVALAPGKRQPATAIAHLQVVGGHVVTTSLVNVTANFSSGQTIVGLAYDPVTTMVFALSVQYAPGATGYQGTPVPGSVNLSMIDVHGGKVAWQQALPNCNLPMEAERYAAPPVYPSAAIGVAKIGHTVNVGCTAQSATNGVNSFKLPIPLGIGVIGLSGKGASTSYRDFGMAPYPADATSDPQGVWLPGIDRMAIQYANTNNGSGWALYDAAHGNYVGAVSITQPAKAVGVDPVHGRVYLLDNNPTKGLVAFDAGVTPADQGHSFKQYAADPINEDNDYGALPTGGLISVDPATSRVFLSYTGSHKFIVAHDTFPHYSPPPPPNVDAATAGIPEVPGQTGANYSGSALGYGSMMREVGGEANLQYNVVPFKLEGVWKSGREVDSSYVDTATLTNSSAVVGLSAGKPDDNTVSQMNQAPWPYTSIKCDNSATEVTGDGGSATCDTNTATIKGTINGGASAAALPGHTAPELIGVGASSVTISSHAEPGKGMTSVVTSAAHGISVLQGALRIGEVSVTSTATANGQNHGARSSFVRTVSRVFVAGKEVCDTNCDVEQLAKQINTTFSGRIQISFPTPDPTLKGSPGGYQAVIQRNPYSQAEETNVNDQEPTRSDVPGMEITIYADNSEPSRTIAYLAGTEVEAHYGVYVLGQNCSTCPPPSTPPTPGGPGGGTGGSSNLPNGGPAAVSGPTNGSPPVVAGGANVGGIFHHGWQLLVSGLGNMLHQFGVWAILLLPVYLSARRWALTNRHDTSGPA
ncbi:MAG: hypothetical protein QOG34_692 [Frankiaceae bacterium]|nr:hypothetical protein [Frankiaceae bacterium]